MNEEKRGTKLCRSSERATLLSQKRVICPFVPHRSRLPMSRVYDGLVRQRPELLADTAHQSRMIPARQIGPANTLPEQNISPDDKTLFFSIKTHTTRRMTRQKENGQPVVAKGHLLTRLQEDKFPPIILKRHAPPKPPSGAPARTGCSFSWRWRGKSQVS